MDLTVLNLALPAISTQLKPSGAQLLWIVDIYGFLVAGFLITMGTLGDRIGRRRLLLAGAAAFGVASIIAAFSTSAEMLIAMRALLGIAGATLAPSTLSLIRNMFHDDAQRQFAIGVWIASFSLGGAIGPLVGGVLLEYFWWGSVFLVAVPVMIALLALGPTLLPEFRDPNAGHVDLPSVVLSLSAVLIAIYGVKRSAEQGMDTVAAIAIGAGIVLAVMFGRRQGRLAYPLLDLKLFRMPRFTAAITAYGLSSLAMFGVYIFITQYLQLVLALSPLQAGWVTLPWALAFVVGSLTAPRIGRHVAPVKLMTGGLAASALGFFLLMLAADAGSLLVLIGGTLLMGFGLAPVFTLGNEMILTSAPPERAGAASAISETTSELSGALGIALFGSIGATMYRTQLITTLPAEMAPQNRAAAMATLGGAVDVASAMDSSIGGALLVAARLAFVDAFHTAALVGAGIMVFATFLAARMLRSRPMA
ncbi:MAG: MFS transporter [Burkholderiales bacterium]|nr:MFS transporter [Burkholderiales bacterium]